MVSADVGEGITEAQFQPVLGEMIPTIKEEYVVPMRGLFMPPE